MLFRILCQNLESNKSIILESPPGMELDIRQEPLQPRSRVPCQVLCKPGSRFAPESQLSQYLVSLVESLAN
jgi:hypothetical protein